MFHEGLGKLHFWTTFLGAYAIYFPMHYLGIEGLPRRYFAMGDADFMSDTAMALNAQITVAALLVGVAQLLFIFNVIWSLRNGERAPSNPWGGTSLEWQTPQNPPAHGNWGNQLPEVHRWAYDYSVPGADEDFVPQNVPEGDEFSEGQAVTAKIA